MDIDIPDYFMQIQGRVIYFSPEPWSSLSVALVFMIDIRSSMFSEDLKCYQINPLRRIVP